MQLWRGLGPDLPVFAMIGWGRRRRGASEDAAAQPVAQMYLLFPRRTACPLGRLGSKRRWHQPGAFRGQQVDSGNNRSIQGQPVFGLIRHESPLEQRLA